ncbi:MAG: hypothetical protein ACTS2F_08415 [Thainema sp.]
MNLQELEANYRSAMSETLSQLQVLQLLAEDIGGQTAGCGHSSAAGEGLKSSVLGMKSSINQIGNSVKLLSLKIEEFIEGSNLHPSS